MHPHHGRTESAFAGTSEPYFGSVAG